MAERSDFIYPRKLIILFAGLCTLFPSPAQENRNTRNYPEVEFEHIGEEQELVKVSECIYQDSRGFIWIGSGVDGLYRYDGYEFKHYQNQYDDSTSLSDNYVTELLFEDSSGDIWITFLTGECNRYNRATDNFTRFQNQPGNPNSVPLSSVSSVAEDHDGNIWLGYFADSREEPRGGLFRVERESGMITGYRNDPGNPGSLSSNCITKLFVDRSGNLWIGTCNRGVDRFVPSEAGEPEKFTHYPFVLGNPEDPVRTPIVKIVKDRSGTLWFGTNSEGMLRYMADADFLRYQALLSDLAGILPAELEEDMYRMKNIRLAEHGFLPPEEALPVYAPLEPDVLKSDEGSGRMPEDMNEDVLDLAPYAPLSLLEGPNLLTLSLSRIPDAHFLDRFRLEFAGLCNQVLSADGLPTQEMEVLKRTCRKSAGYMNLLLEKMCGDDMMAAEALLRNNPLISLFRAGFGLAQKLKWEAEQWIKKSWFRREGFSLSFWGEEWGYTVAGLTAKRPLFCDRHAENREYRDFEHATDLTEASKILHRLMSLDTLLGHLAGMHPLDPEADRTDDLTFHPLIFTLWARRMLHLTPSFKGISLNEAKNLFRLLRRGDDRPPYQMLGFEEVFVKEFMATGLPEVRSHTVFICSVVNLTGSRCGPINSSV